MKVAPYYQKLLKQALNFSRRRHPASFIGMYDCGRNYLFSLLVGKKIDKRDPLLIAVDQTNHSRIEKKISSLSIKKSITLAVNFSHQEKVDSDLINLLYNLSNRWGERINWLIFANYDLLNSKFTDEVFFEKVIKSNMIPILPLDYKNSLVVYDNYQGYFGKGKKSFKKEVIKLSGGNPGLLKSLFLFAKSGKLSKSLTDSQTAMRLNKILTDLTKKELSLLLNLALKNNTNIDKTIFNNLKRFGYLNQKNEIFSPLLKQYFPTFYDEIGLVLSTSQKKVFLFLKIEAPHPVSRDQVAQVLWGGRWREDYSDWAIDQMIYVLRKKLKKIASQWSLLTKKNFGYYLRKKTKSI